MAVPSRCWSDLGVADWADTILFFPEVKELFMTAKTIVHLLTKPFFKVDFPFWVVRVGLSFDFGVPSDGHIFH